jgi:hypothetical protein
VVRCVLALTGLALLVGCGSDNDGPPPPSRDVLGIPQCLRAYGGFALNVPADSRRSRKIVRAGRRVIPTAPANRSLVFAWQTQAQGKLHRTYLVVRGAGATPLADRDARHRAVQMIANPHLATDDYFAFSDLDRPRTAMLDRHCFRNH